MSPEYQLNIINMLHKLITPNNYVPSIYMQAVALKKANDREAKHPQIPPHLEINHLQYN